MNRRCSYLVLSSRFSIERTLQRMGLRAFGPGCLLSWGCGGRCGWRWCRQRWNSPPPKGQGSRGEGNGGLSDSGFFPETLCCPPRPGCTSGAHLTCQCPGASNPNWLGSHLWVLGEVSTHPVSMGPQLTSGMGPPTKGPICHRQSLGPQLREPPSSFPTPVEF